MAWLKRSDLAAGQSPMPLKPYIADTPLEAEGSPELPVPPCRCSHTGEDHENFTGPCQICGDCPEFAE